MKMPTITVQMPSIRVCSISDCSYNADQACHARAITVGDGAEPNCDTFSNNPRCSPNISQIAGVGACKVHSCTFNEKCECQADSIEVGENSHGIQCLTFAPR